ncbi:hypothetical protein MTO96_051989 [Rhipicephalus appendiculatus]
MAASTLATTEEVYYSFIIRCCWRHVSAKLALLLKFTDSAFDGFVETFNIGIVDKTLQLEGNEVTLRVRRVRWWAKVHAEAMENAVGLCDKGAKRVNDEKHTAVDEEIAGKRSR